MIDGLRNALLLFHLSLAHWACWGPLFAAVCCFTSRSTPQRLGLLCIRSSLACMVGGAMLGLVAIGLCISLAPTNPFTVLLTRIPSARWKMVAGEWAFSVALTAVALGLLSRPRTALIRWTSFLLLAAAATNLLYHFPMFFTACHAAAVQVAPTDLTTLDARLESQAFKQYRFSPYVIALAVHHVTAGLAWSGILFAQFAVRLQQSQYSESDSASYLAAARWGARIALVATLAQVLIGPWVALRLPLASRNAVMGGDLPVTLCLGAGILTALWLLQILANYAFLPDRSGGRWASIAWTMSTFIMLMTNSWLRWIEFRDC